MFKLDVVNLKASRSKLFFDIFVWFYITAVGSTLFDVGICVLFCDFYAAAKMHNLSCSKCTQL